MLHTKRTTPILALVGALALMTAAPVLAQPAAPAPATAPGAAPAAAPAPAAAATPEATPAAADQAPTRVGGANAGHLNPWEMFKDARLVVQIVMVGLAICSLFSWTILILKIFEFVSMNRITNRFLESWRGAKSIAEMGRIAESEEFARQLQKEVYRRTTELSGKQRDRGVKKAPFVVLIGANMPSVLAEISFLTNPHDEKSLRRSDYRQKIAEALYEGILDYVNNLGGVKVVQRAASDRTGSKTGAEF